MSKTVTAITKKDEAAVEGAAIPRCAAVAVRGVRTANQVALLMSEIIADLAEQKVTPQTANAMINASGKLMKAAELQQKYGTSGSGGQDRDLLLVREQSIQ